MGTLYEVCLIGAGNVATQLALNLQKNGFTIKAIFSRDIEHARILARQVNCPTATDSLEQIPPADFFVFSIKDSVLEQTVRKLMDFQKDSDAVFVHTAGSMPLSVLSNYCKNAAVLYPMQTISKSRDLDFRQVPLFIEASNDECLQKIEDVATTLSDHVTRLDSAQRKKLHLSAVFACNFTNHCYALAYKLLEDSAIDPRCLLPLIDETARKVHDMHPKEGQTGPAVRWDENVMNQQLQTLKDFPEMQELYVTMSKSIHKEALS